jgi:hypothetical protein
MRQFEASRYEVANWKWPTQYVTPACRCSDHLYPHVHPPFASWDAKPEPEAVEPRPVQGLVSGGSGKSFSDWREEVPGLLEQLETVKNT